MNIGGDGFLHRDVAIGNVLKPERPVQRPPFSTSSLKLFEPYCRPTASEYQGVATNMNNAAAADAVVKPNDEYLNTLHESRKRFRSRDNVGTETRTPKMPRIGENMDTEEDVALPEVGIMRLEKIDDAHGDGDFWTTLRSNLAHDEYLVQVANAAERLENALKKLGLSTTCRALISDGDTAARLKTYFTESEHAGVFSVSSCDKYCMAHL